jgi:hypothetical protein
MAYQLPSTSPKFELLFVPDLSTWTHTAALKEQGVSGKLSIICLLPEPSSHQVATHHHFRGYPSNAQNQAYGPRYSGG